MGGGLIIWHGFLGIKTTNSYPDADGASVNNPQLSCSFMSNGALNGLPGGALMAFTSAVDMASCSFDGNYATIGGAVFSQAGSTVLIDRLVEIFV